MTSKPLISTAVLALGALVWACAPDAPASDGSGEAMSSTFNVSLATTNESGVQGLTTVSLGDETTFKLELMGLTSEETYTAALHAGTCDSPGERLAELNQATSGAVGIGSSVTGVESDVLEGPDALNIQAHLPDGTMAACGDVPMERLP